jgi:hypothetical protein
MQVTKMMGTTQAMGTMEATQATQMTQANNTDNKRRRNCEISSHLDSRVFKKPSTVLRPKTIGSKLENCVFSLISEFAIAHLFITVSEQGLFIKHVDRSHEILRGLLGKHLHTVCEGVASLYPGSQRVYMRVHPWFAQYGLLQLPQTDQNCIATFVFQPPDHNKRN